MFPVNDRHITMEYKMTANTLIGDLVALEGSRRVAETIEEITKKKVGVFT